MRPALDDGRRTWSAAQLDDAVAAAAKTMAAAGVRRGVPLQEDPQRILDVVDRELSVPLAVWQGYQLIDRVDREEEGPLADLIAGRAQRNLEHVFTLLASILPREPLQVSFHGLRSEDASLRALAAD